MLNNKKNGNTITQQSKISLAVVITIVSGLVLSGSFVYSIKAQQNTLQVKVDRIDDNYVSRAVLNAKLDSIQKDINYIKQEINSVISK